MPSDRAPLIAALRPATPAQLREDAALMMGMVACRVELLGLDSWSDAWKRCAALALAVATMQEETDVELEKCGGNVYLTTAMSNEKYYSLPAALAALLEDA